MRRDRRCSNIKYKEKSRGGNMRGIRNEQDVSGRYNSHRRSFAVLRCYFRNVRPGPTQPPTTSEPSLAASTYTLSGFPTSHGDLAESVATPPPDVHVPRSATAARKVRPARRHGRLRRGRRMGLWVCLLWNWHSSYMYPPSTDIYTSIYIGGGMYIVPACIR